MNAIIINPPKQTNQFTNYSVTGSSWRGDALQVLVQLQVYACWFGGPLEHFFAHPQFLQSLKKEIYIRKKERMKHLWQKYKKYIKKI